MRDRYASLREGLVGAWIPSVSGSGLLLPDLSGHGNNGALTNMGPEDWVSGQYGRALDFDGVDDYVDVASSNVPVGINPVSTRSFWVNQRSVVNDVNFSILEQTRTGQDEAFIIVLNKISNVHYLFTDSVNSNNNIVITGNEIPTLNTWNHIVFSTGASSNWEYWLNGKLAKFGVFSSTMNLTGTSLNIGRRTTVRSGYFDGQLDDIRIYNRALSEPEIKLLSQEPGVGFKRTRSVFDFGRKPAYLPPTPTDYRTVRVKQTEHASLREGLVGAWCPSIEGSGYTLPDLSGQGNNGTLTNMGPEDWVSGQYGRALDFDGVDDYVMTPKNPVGGYSQMTCECWVSLRSLSSGFAGIVGSWSASTANRSWVLLLNSSKWTFGTGNGTSQTLAVAPSTTTLDVPTHICGVRNYATNKLYINGVESASNSTHSGTIAIGNDTSLIGVLRTDDPTRFYANCQIWQATCYNRALSEPEIKFLASRPGIGLRPQRRSMYYAPPTGARRRRILTSMP